MFVGGTFPARGFACGWVGGAVRRKRNLLLKTGRVCYAGLVFHTSMVAQTASRETARALGKVGDDARRRRIIFGPGLGWGRVEESSDSRKDARKSAEF